MNIKNAILPLLVIFVSVGCQRNENKVNKSDTEISTFATTLKNVGEKIFDLDSVTPYFSNTIQLYKDADGKQYLCLLNAYTNAIYFYAYEDGRVQTRISLRKEGTNKGREIQSFVVKNLDSIYVLSKDDFVLSLINREGKIIESNNLRFFTDGPTTRPMVLHKNKLFIGSYESPEIDGFTKLENLETENLVTVFDTKTKQLSSVLSYPESYKGGIWGLYLLQYYYTFNPLTEKFVISFSADHSIYETDFAKKAIPHEAASRYFSTISSNQDDKTDADSRLRYYLSTPSYQNIVFDPYQNLYYRIALQPISSDDLAANDPEKSIIKPASIIILDSHFKKIGEELLPRFSYTETMFFVSPDGLFIANWEASRKNESKLFFTNFRPTTKSHEK